MAAPIARAAICTPPSAALPHRHNARGWSRPVRPPQIFLFRWRRGSDPISSNPAAAVSDAELLPWPIPGNHILQGNPEAKGGICAVTPGSFNTTYIWDETLYVVEGGGTITSQNGDAVSLGPGDLAFIPHGTRSRWDVTETVRKVFQLRAERPVQFPD